MPETERKIYRISELARQIQGVLTQTFPALWLRGEIAECSLRQNAAYLTLKDETARIKVVFFRGVERLAQLDLSLGMEVEVFGNLSTYPQGSNYQIRGLLLQPVGQGTLYQRYLEMRSRLQAEGLFDMARKRPVPRFPKIIGVVTSPDGAAIRDFLKTLQLQHAGIHVRIFPVPVQGADAARRVAAAIAYADRYSLCDVLVVTRGGGSPEDLWTFNEESVARAIDACRIPVISAVGHERDFTIADEVADLRCATPTAAARAVIAEKKVIGDHLLALRQRLLSLLQLRFSQVLHRYEICRKHPLLQNPMLWLEARVQQLDLLQQQLTRSLPVLAERQQSRWENLRNRLLQAGKNLVPARKMRLDRLSGMLAMLGPDRVLERGYAIVRNVRGGIVRSAEEVSPGDLLQIRLGKGGVSANVREKMASSDGGGGLP